MQTNPIRAIWVVVGAILAMACSERSTDHETKTAAQVPAKQKATVKRTPVSKRKRQRRQIVPEQIANKNPKSLLGGERGFDHVGIAVRDLEGAGKHYADKLGFGKPQAGRLPNGLQNINFYFGDTTYLELLKAYDAKKNPWVSGFLAKHERGALFAVLTTYAYDWSAAFLKRVGHPVGKPLPGRISVKGMRFGKGPLWHTFYFEKWPLPGNVNNVFFISYKRSLRNAILHRLKNEALRRKTFKHANTALGMSAAWVAVKNLEQAKKAYAAIGLTQAKEAKVPPLLQAKALTVQAGEGHFLLLQPKAAGKGPVARFLKERGEGILGISVRVEHLKTAQHVVQRGLAKKLPSYRGPLGEAFVVAPSDAVGVYLEFVQSKTDK